MEKQSHPKAMNFLRRRVTLKRFGFIKPSSVVSPRSSIYLNIMRKCPWCNGYRR